ncbi:unnamed protein product [Diplocarpon coronariae]
MIKGCKYIANSTYNPCLLLTLSTSPFFGIVGIQTDNTLILKEADFLKKEEDKIKRISYIIVLATKEEGESQFTLKGNILYYSLIKYKRVIRAILASELYTIVAGINMLVSIAMTIDIVIAKLSLSRLLTIVYIDSLSLYKYIVKLGTIKEKRLIIDIMAIRQSTSNPADAIIKANPNQALKQLVDTNSITIRKEG